MPRRHGIGGIPSPGNILFRFDRELRELVADKFPQEPLTVLHRVFAAIGKAPE